MAEKLPQWLLSNVWTRTLSLVAFTGFGITLTLHLLTYFGINPNQYFPYLPILIFYSMFVVFLPMVYLAGVQWKRKNSIENTFNRIPVWLRGVLILAFIYFVGTILLYSKEGVTDKWDDKYVIHNHGQLIREITEEEYHLQELYNFRHDITFYGLFFLAPAIYFLYYDTNEIWWQRTEAESKR